MLRTGKLLLAALTATAIFGVVVSSASANRLSVNESGWRVTWTSLEWRESIFGIGFRCPVTMEGSFHSATISKVTGGLIGNTTRVAIGTPSCTGGHMTMLTERLPWAISYQGFTGRLPNIESLKILLIRPAFKLEIADIVNCLSEPSRINAIIRGRIEASGSFKPETLSPEREVTRCGELNLVFSGTGTVTKRGSTERFLIRLI